MEILIIAPNSALHVELLGRLDDGVHVAAVGWAKKEGIEGVRYITVPPPRGLTARLRSAILPLAMKNVITRSLLRLSGFDEGVWFFKAAQRVPDATAAARAAQVIISSERDAIYTAWRWGQERQRSSSPAAAVHGYPAGRAAIVRSLGR